MACNDIFLHQNVFDDLETILKGYRHCNNWVHTSHLLEIGFSGAQDVPCGFIDFCERKKVLMYKNTIII